MSTTKKGGAMPKKLSPMEKEMIAAPFNAIRKGLDVIQKHMEQLFLKEKNREHQASGGR